MQNPLNEEQVRRALEQLEEAIQGAPAEFYGVDFRDIDEDEEAVVLEGNQRGFVRLAIEIARAGLNAPIDRVIPTQELNAHRLKFYLHRFVDGAAYDAFKSPPPLKGWRRYLNDLMMLGCLGVGIFLVAMVCLGISTLFGGCGRP